MKDHDPPVSPGIGLHVGDGCILQAHRTAEPHAAVTQVNQGWFVLVVEILKDARCLFLEAAPRFAYLVPEGLQRPACQGDGGDPGQKDDDEGDHQPGPQESGYQFRAIADVGLAPLLLVHRQAAAHHQQQGSQEKEDQVDGQVRRGVGHVDQQRRAPEDDGPPYPLPAKHSPGCIVGDQPHQE